MENLRKQVSLNTLLLGIGFFVLESTALAILHVAHVNEAGIQTSRDVAAALAEHNEKLMVDFMARTVQRWDKLAHDNSNITVPRVVEPMSGALIDPEAMQRPQSTPTP